MVPEEPWLPRALLSPAQREAGLLAREEEEGAELVAEGSTFK